MYADVIFSLLLTLHSVQWQLCTLIAFQGTNITYLEATDPDDEELMFDIVGDDTVLAAGPLLRIVKDGHKTATVFLNARLNAVVCSHS